MARDARPEELPARNVNDMSFAEFIEYASGGNHDPPWHLGKYFDLMSSLDGGELRICVSMPPQHCKTTTCHYAIAYALLRNPKLLFGYGSYGKQFASDQTERIRDIYIACGGEMKKDHNRRDNWRTAQGGGLLACSPDSGLLGYRIDVLVLDDIVDGAESMSVEANRNKVWNWLHGTAFQRTWVKTSIVVIGTRWHPDDPIGRLIVKGYDEINLPAIRTEDGIEYALWPDVKPLEWLDLKRRPTLADGSVNRDYIGEYEWQTQYQGKPVAREGAIFGPPRWYSDLPTGAEVVVVGIDLGYGPEGTSDYSVAVALAHLDGLYYVHDVVRMRTTLEAATEALAKMAIKYPYPCRYGSYMGGPEKGIHRLLFARGIAIEKMPAHHNKWTRSQKCADAWRTGRIMIRKGQPWSDAFAREVEFFDGNERGHDDQVDALVSGFDLVELNAPVGWAGQGFAFGRAVM